MSGSITEYDPPSVNSLRGMCSGPDGNLWICDLGGNAIYKMTTGGSFTRYTTGLSSSSQPHHICSGPDGNLWFTQYGISKVSKITTGGTITEVASLTASSTPYGICSDGTNLWACGYAQNKIAKVTTAGSVTEYALGSSARPAFITVGSDGYLWISCYGGDNNTTNEGNSIAKMNPADGSYTSYTVASSSKPNGIWAGSDGAVWFTRQGDNKVSRINTSGTITDTFTCPSAASAPAGICQVRDGRLWLAERSANKLAAMSYDGTFSEYSSPAGAALYWPVPGPDGNLFYSSFGTYNKVASVTVDNPSPRRPTARQAVTRAATR